MDAASRENFSPLWAAMVQGRMTSNSSALDVDTNCEATSTTSDTDMVDQHDDASNPSCHHPTTTDSNARAGKRNRSRSVKTDRSD